MLGTDPEVLASAVPERPESCTWRRSWPPTRGRAISGAPGVCEPWLAGLDPSIQQLTDDPPLTHAQLDAVDAVITSSAVAIAETGTIVLDAGSGQGRRPLSLLPDCDVCVVPDDRRRRHCLGTRAIRAAPAADLDQRSVGDERHRARSSRGGPWARKLDVVIVS